MKKVLFKKWIPKVMVKEGNFQRPKEGTAKFEDGFVNEGVFMEFGVDYEELELGAGNYTVALVMVPDGTIEQVLPQNIKFVV